MSKFLSAVPVGVALALVCAGGAYARPKHRTDTATVSTERSADTARVTPQERRAIQEARAQLAAARRRLRNLQQSERFRRMPANEQARINEARDVMDRARRELNALARNGWVDARAVHNLQHELGTLEGLGMGGGEGMGRSGMRGGWDMGGPFGNGMGSVTASLENVMDRLRQGRGAHRKNGVFGDSTGLSAFTSPGGYAGYSSAPGGGVAGIDRNSLVSDEGEGGGEEGEGGVETPRPPPNPYVGSGGGSNSSGNADSGDQGGSDGGDSGRRGTSSSSQNDHETVEERRARLDKEREEREERAKSVGERMKQINETAHDLEEEQKNEAEEREEECRRDPRRCPDYGGLPGSNGAGHLTPQERAVERRIGGNRTPSPPKPGPKVNPGPAGRYGRRPPRRLHVYMPYGLADGPGTPQRYKRHAKSPAERRRIMSHRCQDCGAGGWTANGGIAGPRRVHPIVRVPHRHGLHRPGR